MADKKLASAAKAHLDSIARASAGDGHRMRLDYADRQGMTAALARKKIKTEGRSDAYVAKRYADAFAEEDHPRDEHGRFGGGAAVKAQADLASKHAAAAGASSRKASAAPTAEKAEKHAKAADEHARAARAASNAATALANPSGDFKALEHGGKSILSAKRAEASAANAKSAFESQRAREHAAKAAAPRPDQPVSMKAAVPSTPGEKLGPRPTAAASEKSVAAAKVTAEANRASDIAADHPTDRWHTLAAGAHFRAADAQRAAGNTGAAAKHEEEAVGHTRQASPLDVTHEGKRYNRTGKYGRDMKTGAPSAEYRNTEAGDARVWHNLRTGETKPD